MSNVLLLDQNQLKKIFLISCGSTTVDICSTLQYYYRDCFKYCGTYLEKSSLCMVSIIDSSASLTESSNGLMDVTIRETID